MSSPVYLAIDTPHLDAALTLAQRVRHHVGGLKLGLEFFCANGHHGVHEMAKLGLPIFLDLKLHDIPNTVAKAIQALRPLEPAILTVHAAGGRAMMEEAKAEAKAEAKPEPKAEPKVEEKPAPAVALKGNPNAGTDQPVHNNGVQWSANDIKAAVARNQGVGLGASKDAILKALAAEGLIKGPSV